MERLDRNKLHSDVKNYVEVFNIQQAVQCFLNENRTLILAPYQVNSFLKCLEEMKTQVEIKLVFNTDYTPFYLAKRII